MKQKYFNIIFLFNIAFCYYSLKLNKIYLQQLVNDNNNSIEYNETLQQYLDNLADNIDLPLNYSELNSINQSFIQTKNINLEQYAVTLYLCSNKQKFILMLSTIDDYITISSINCSLCNVTNKYNSILSKTNKKFNDLINKSNLNQTYEYEFFQDLFTIPTQSIKNHITENNRIQISTYFKVIERDSLGFLNSDLVDGILGLNYKNNSELINMNFIRELYNEKYISSPSFSIIISSSNYNRLYLGDIMQNEYIKNYLNSSLNKGECNIIENNWKCKLKYIEYNALNYPQWDLQTERSFSTVTFDLKENKLIIPDKYYDLIVVSYHIVSEKYGDTHVRTRKYNKFCKTYDGIIYCSCLDKDDFGIVTFHFENNAKLDIDLRDYVYYNKSVFYLKCKVDIILSSNDEFIVGLRGLNNSILSFNMEDKTIKFFQKFKKTNNYRKIKIIIVIICLVFSLIFLNFQLILLSLIALICLIHKP